VDSFQKKVPSKWPWGEQLQKVEKEWSLMRNELGVKTAEFESDEDLNTFIEVSENSLIS
jgi:hypothetical protein